MYQAELYEKLGRKLAESAIEAGWIKPVCEAGGSRGRKSIIYSVEDWRRVEERILKGEYPEKK